MFILQIILAVFAIAIGYKVYQIYTEESEGSMVGWTIGFVIVFLMFIMTFFAPEAEVVEEAASGAISIIVSQV